LKGKDDYGGGGKVDKGTANEKRKWGKSLTGSGECGGGKGANGGLVKEITEHFWGGSCGKQAGWPGLLERGDGKGMGLFGRRGMG